LLRTPASDTLPSFEVWVLSSVFAALSIAALSIATLPIATLRSSDLGFELLWDLYRRTITHSAEN
jgi:hypothetical protein